MKVTSNHSSTAAIEAIKNSSRIDWTPNMKSLIAQNEGHSVNRYRDCTAVMVSLWMNTLIQFFSGRFWWNKAEPSFTKFFSFPNVRFYDEIWWIHLKYEGHNDCRLLSEIQTFTGNNDVILINSKNHSLSLSMTNVLLLFLLNKKWVYALKWYRRQWKFYRPCGGVSSPNVEKVTHFLFLSWKLRQWPLLTRFWWASSCYFAFLSCIRFLFFLPMRGEYEG